MNFQTRLSTVIAEGPAPDPQARRLLTRALVDTVVVALPGFGEAVSKATGGAFLGEGPADWSGQRRDAPESAVMVNAVAAHALDFDDVFLESATHPSTVIVPAILTEAPVDEDRMWAAFGAGLIAARAVNARLGPGHYDRGWHGTGTVGAFAAAAAAARLAGLDPTRTRHALGLAAAMSGGLQANFGTMAKPCQAGFAAAAGIRSVRLAAAGVTAGDRALDDGGYIGLYGDPKTALPDDVFSLRADRISVKLYPCCYAANRPIGVALDVRATLAGGFARSTRTARLTMPAGSLRVLRFRSPTTGLEAKFSAHFAVAAALIDGPPTLATFTDEAARRPDLIDATARVDVVEEGVASSDIQHGLATLEILEDGKVIAAASRRAIPGSPDDPPTRAQFAAKRDACIAAASPSIAEAMLTRLSRLDACREWLD